MLNLIIYIKHKDELAYSLFADIVNICFEIPCIVTRYEISCIPFGLQIPSFAHHHAVFD